jgi:cysteine-S-conjugate beta-lyase
MKYDFDTLPNRRDSDSVKWNHYDEGILPMWVADMDFLSPPPVIEALKKRMEHGIFGYPVGVEGNPKDLSELRQLLVERMDRLYGWKISPEDLIFLPGVAVGFNLACHTASPGSVLVETPVYPPFLKAPKNTGMELQMVELVQQADGSYTVDFDAFEASITDKTKLFILCNPHNPVGRVFTREELERMGEICQRRGVLVCSDEIHCDLVYPGHTHIPIATLSEACAANTITLMAPSKTYNIPGLSFSFAVVQDVGLRRRFRRAQQGLVSWVNSIGITAGTAAYAEGDDWLSELMVYLRGNRDFLHQFVLDELPGIGMALPEGTYLAWLDCRESGIPGNPFQFFLEKAGVALMDGAAFGPGGEGFVRLNFGCPRPMLEQALVLMREAYRSLQISGIMR